MNKLLCFRGRICYKQKMKKALLTFLTLLIIASFLFVGCNEPPVPEENTGSGTTQQGGSQEKPNGGTSGGGTTNIPATATVTDILLSKASDYSDETPKLVAKAKYDDSSEKDVTSDATWKSSDVSVATVSAGEISILSTGTTVITATYSNVESGKATITVTENVSGGTINKLYFMTTKQWDDASPRYAAYFFGNGEKWVDMTLHAEKVYVCDKQEGYPSVIFCRMNPATTDNKWDNRWDQTADLTIPRDKDTYKYGEGQWSEGSGEWVSELTGSYSDSDSTYSVNVSIKNTNNYVDPNAPDIEPAPDTFTWDNVNAYFVLTDRFANGDSSNDHSYNRKNGLSGNDNVATFHGGDIKGLTENMDYFKKLGINAIWITAPYEQSHGWVSGKDSKFPHYAFHGYYTLDWTFMDKNMGTIDEFREFVQTCHANGIRVIMDVVMNHVGYNNTEDMITYNHGYTEHKEHGWLEKIDGVWNANDTVKWDNNLWEGWWGYWARSFGYAGGEEYGGSCGGLPDIRSEDTSTNKGIAPILKTKWAAENNSSYDNWRVPAVADVDWWNKSGDWRTDKTARIVEYQVIWLSSWVREFGIDGFRCDTAKHVQKEYWAMLKDACTDALKKWREDDSKIDYSGAKDWDESFWMTGESWGWTKSLNDSYFSTGKFDSMIDFTFNGGNNWNGNYRTNYPNSSSWSSYLDINNSADSDNNGNRNNCLTYISSHDTGLTRVGDQYEVGTGLVLLPGGVQIYYGDESYRQKAYEGCGDGDMMTRGDMNLTEAKSSALVVHWGKVGTFRKFNPAVGAGTGSAYKRTYNGTNAGGQNKVAIGVSGSSVDVSGLFDNGTKVYNWYDGKSTTVSGGKVTFNGGSMTQPILVSDRNPADYGVEF